ncbi:hypothetical protein OSCI_1090025 [Kamptonema sp. PCC 6506]|nr:hypothetical protein OSCI_1090025 [Kamptonema sp. PCC 6506]
MGTNRTVESELAAVLVCTEMKLILHKFHFKRGKSVELKLFMFA